jgi:hypothetical protein
VLVLVEDEPAKVTCAQLHEQPPQRQQRDEAGRHCDRRPEPRL